MNKSLSINPAPLTSLKGAIGADKAKDYLERFLQECPGKTTDIVSAYEASDFTLLQYITHTLASSAATFGADDLHAHCLHIEDNCARENYSNMSEDIKHLKALSSQSCILLEQML